MSKIGKFENNSIHFNEHHASRGDLTFYPRLIDQGIT